MSESLSDQSNEDSRTASDALDDWIKSIGETAAPVLAGFSFTVVIVVSDDATHFRWPGEAILALTVAAITLIAAFQSSKYARDKRWPGADRPKSSIWWTRFRYYSLTAKERTEVWRKATRNFYHLGISALLAGLAFTLAPQYGTGVQGMLRWTASGIAFAACVIETVAFLTAGRHHSASPDEHTAGVP